jgi:hypothetical protein
MSTQLARCSPSKQLGSLFVEEEKPGFVLNAVLPNANIDHFLSIEHQGCPGMSGLPSRLSGTESYIIVKISSPCRGSTSISRIMRVFM